MSSSNGRGVHSGESGLYVSGGGESSKVKGDGYREYSDVLHVAGQAEAREAVGKVPSSIVIVKRGRPRTVLFRCPCGCGETLVINVDPRAGKAWRLRRSVAGVTLLPSVWRTTGCRSHFVLWESRVWWCRFDEGDDSHDWPLEVEEALRKARRRAAPE
jgi:hypothetical protein